MVKRFYIFFLLFIPFMAVCMIGGLWLMGNVNQVLGIAVMVVGITAGSIALQRKITGKSEADKAILENGVEADAQITNVRDLNMTINNVNYAVRLTLQVQPIGAAPFQAELEIVVSRVQVPPVGAWLKVKFDPANPSHVVMSGDTITVGEPAGTATSSSTTVEPSPDQVVDFMKQHGLDQAVASGQSLVASPNMDPEKATAILQAAEDQLNELKVSGTEAKAAIIELHPLGIFVNGNNQGATATLTVMPEGGEPFAGQATGIISEASWPHYQPGNVVLVKFDPNNKSRISFFKTLAQAAETSG